MMRHDVVSRRTERIASLIRGIVAAGIRTELSDPRIETFTSITRVEVSPDLSVAHILVSVMAEEPRRKLTLAGLEQAAGRLRGLVASRISLRQVPRLVFRLDDSVRRSCETVQQLDELMAEIAARTGPPVPDHPPATGPDEQEASE
jgi:ribosome-binding factor A